MNQTVAPDIESTFHIDPADLELYAPGDGHRRVGPYLHLNCNRTAGRWTIRLAFDDSAVDGEWDDERDGVRDEVLFEAKDEQDLRRLGDAFATLFARLEDGTPL